MASAGFQIFRAPVRAASLTQPRSANWAIRRRYSKHEFVILAGYPALVIAVRDGHPTPSRKSENERSCTRHRRLTRLRRARSEEHTSELQSLMRISYAVFC